MAKGYEVIKEKMLQVIRHANELFTEGEHVILIVHGGNGSVAALECCEGARDIMRDYVENPKTYSEEIGFLDKPNQGRN